MARMSQYIVEYQAFQEPVVGVPTLEHTNSDWKNAAPAVFATEAEAAEYMQALSLYYASVLETPHEGVKRFFRVVPLAESKAENLSLIEAK